MNVYSKIWRTVKRPFKKIWREIKRPFLQRQKFLQQQEALLRPVLAEIKRMRDELQSEWQRLDHKNHAMTPDEYKKYLTAELGKLKTELKYELTRSIQRGITTAVLHQKTFAGYKNKHRGQSVVLIGAGPSLNDFIPIENAIYVGLNRACLYEKVKLDYLFAMDRRGIEPISDKFAGYPCTKFIGERDSIVMTQIPESEIIKMNALPFMTDIGFRPSQFCLDIESGPLGAFSTIAMPAMQFILYTNPAVIYLAGCDASPEGHFTKDHPQHFEIEGYNQVMFKWSQAIIGQWQQLKSFASMHYPDTKIISVNPVGLKGMFHDIYTNE